MNKDKIRRIFLNTWIKRAHFFATDFFWLSMRNRKRSIFIILMQKKNLDNILCLKLHEECIYHFHLFIVLIFGPANGVVPKARFSLFTGLPIFDECPFTFMLVFAFEVLPL